jgi:hypothetical protein
MLDFQYLADKDFPEELLEEAFTPAEGEINDLDGAFADLHQRGELEAELLDPNVEESCVAAVAFLHRMLPPTLFNDVVERGVKQAVREYYPEYEVVDASYEPDIRSPEKAYERAERFLENGFTLSDEQVRLLLERGEVEPEKIAEHVQRDTQPFQKHLAEFRKEGVEHLSDGSTESSSDGDGGDPEAE